jgi:hypothetical protein
VKLQGPEGTSIELSEAAYTVWRRLLLIQGSNLVRSGGRCVLEELVNGGHEVFHELVNAEMVQIATWEPGPLNPETRTN